MLRLFVGLDLAPTARERLAVLASGLQGARWVDPASYHVTLAFIGELDAAAAQNLDRELSLVKAASFDLEISGVGSFETKGKLRAIWAGVTLSKPLELLQGRVAAACARAEINLEARKFKPHVSLARFKEQPSKDRLGDWLMSNGLLRLPPWPVQDFVLFRSHLGGTGPHYEVLARYTCLQKE
ncbi:MAG: RNA 2',3'-cyclic phosphodiesterase [Alphaproteobacteria bacterium]|nr:RNA 2',3'-cyclic phosphodiesterase [Alphaproteobacteria bacterium]